MSKVIPLIIDLDGTLYRSDSLLEGLLQLLRTHPCGIIKAICILISGCKAELKQYLASYSLKTLDHQPLNPAVQEYMLLSRAQGCPLYLATAADISVAEDVAGRFGCFDGVFASSVCAGKGVNLRGDVKAARLVQEFGEHGFDYIGDDLSDLDVWTHCRKAVLVGGNRRILRKAKAAGLSLTELPSPEADIGVYLRALRSRQWVKNLLLGVPAFLMHVVTPEVLLRVTLAFIAFCACASVVYVLNDLLDLPADRLHPSKKNRPFASGILPLRQAPKLIAGGMLLTVAPCLFLPSDFASAVGVYFALNVAYSFVLKRRLFLDVLLLSMLYVLRIAAGSAASGIEYSNWLLSFSMFIFTCLALVKRSAELLIHEAGSRDTAAGRAYLVRDRGMLEMLAAGSGMASVMVFCLYIDSQRALGLYTHPQMLWLIAPLLLYWIGRMLLLAHRGAMNDDPVYFAVKDRTSIMCAVASIGVVCAAM